VGQAMSNLSKRRCEGMLLVGLIPFLVIAWNEIDWSKLSPMNGQERKCAIYHQHAQPAHKCDTFEETSPYFHG
jgi:hypothetical protein